MGNLPPSRITPSSSFTCVGTDFARPITLKQGHTRKPVMVKAYICLFICLATKAIPLELVTDLSTEEFMAAFSRFSSKRGCPEEILSDNGSNYVEANHELRRLHNLLLKKYNRDRICQFFLTKRIKWSFSPSRAPHFEGIWEAGVKSAKTLLRKTIGSHSLNIEEYNTVLTEVEAVLNSRPLCALESPSDDGIDVLTPGHFLIGRLLIASPQPSMDDFNLAFLKRWNLCHRLASEFWHRWSREYLNLLQRRSKWTGIQKNLIVGDVVMVKDQELFIRTRPLAVVIQTHPGVDGRVRSITVRTSKGIYKRPVVKRVKLFSSDDSPSSSEGRRCTRQ